MGRCGVKNPLRVGPACAASKRRRESLEWTLTLHQDLPRQINMPDRTSTPISWQQLRQLIISYRKPLLLAHLIALLVTLISVPVPLLMPLLVDEVLLQQPAGAVKLMNRLLPESWQGPTGYILSILTLVVLLRLLTLAFGVLQSRQFTIIGKQISFYIRRRLVDHLPSIQLAEYETRGAASISSRCITDVETLDTFISETLSKFLVSLLTIIGTATVLLWLDWQLGLIILLLNPAVIYFSRAFGKRVKHLKQKENAAFEAFQQALVETLDAIQQLRAVHRETPYFRMVVQAAEELKEHAVASHWKTEAVNRLSFTIFLIGFEGFRAIAMLMVVFSDLTVGQIFAVFGYLWFMMGPVQELLGIQYSFYGASAALSRLNEIFALRQEPFFPCQVDPFAGNRPVAIEFERVSFAYQGENAVLREVSLTIPAGKQTALVAVSGGGKSTLVQLLLGLYQQDQGAIRINGFPLEQIGYQTVRRHVATVLQQPVLFNASVRDNLSMGQPHGEAQLWQALEVAELADTIRQLPRQLDTLVGRNGVRLSGGQRQRLAIARMVLSQPQMVVLDEATSALDTDTEARLHRNLNAFLKQRTSLIIAHRLSAIREADLIYVLDDGRISQVGKHQELIRQEGLYQTLYGHVIQS